MSTHEPVIDVAGLARRFGARKAVSGITMRVRHGEVVGLVGANGGGKTTTTTTTIKKTPKIIDIPPFTAPVPVGRREDVFHKPKMTLWHRKGAKFLSMRKLLR